LSLVKSRHFAPHNVIGAHDIEASAASPLASPVASSVASWPFVLVLASASASRPASIGPPLVSELWIEESTSSISWKFHTSAHATTPGVKRARSVMRVAFISTVGSFRCSSKRHIHWPPEHMPVLPSPTGQIVPQPPQLFESLEKLTHVLEAEQ
jgi:hypothetical protein